MTAALCITSILLIVLGHLYKAVSLNILRPNMTTLVSILLLLGNSALLFYLVAPEAYAALGPKYKSFIFFPVYPAYLAEVHFCATLGWLLGAPGGRFLISRTVRRGPVAPGIYLLGTDQFLLRYWRFIIMFSLVACVAYVVVIGGMQRLPLYMMLTGADPMGIVWAREEAFKYLPWYQAYPFHLFRAFVFPVLAIFAYLVYRNSRSKFTNALRLFIMLTIAAAFNASSSALGPIMVLVLYIGFAELLQRRQQSIVSALRVLLLGVLIFPVHYLMVAFASGDWRNPIDDAIQLFTEQIAFRGYTVIENGAVFNLAFPPEMRIGIGGQAKLAQLFNVDPVPVNNILFNYIAPTSEVSSGTYNGAWFHYDMIMFGPIGVLAGALLVGFTMGGIDEYFRLQIKTVLTSSLYVFSIVVTLGLMDRPFSTWLVSHGGVLGVLLDIVLRQLFPSKFDKGPRIPLVYPRRTPRWRSKPDYPQAGPYS